MVVSHVKSQQMMQITRNTYNCDNIEMKREGEKKRLRRTEKNV